MKTYLSLFFAMLSMGLFAQESSFSKNRIIAALKNDLKKNVSDLNEFEELASIFNSNLVEKVTPLDIRNNNFLNGRPLVIIFKNDIEVENIIKKLEETNLFQYVEPDYIQTGSGIKIATENKVQITFTPFATTPNDPYFFRQWGLNNNGTFSLSPATVDADVDMTEAWDISTGSNAVKMAVIDSGISMLHPEFSGRIMTNSLESINGIDDDGNSYIDDFQGWDFVNNDNNPSDDHGHGTNVTGIAMANANNSIGYAGVDWNCKLLPLKVLNSSNSGLSSNIIASFYYAISKNVDVISISIGGSGFSTAYQNAVNLAYTQNIVVVACMMNFNNATPYYPAAFPTVIAVGSTNPNDTRTNPFFWSTTSGSNFGAHLDVVAPGNYMYGLSHTSTTSYDSYWGGTSQTTPLVAGITSLMLAVNPTLTVDQISSILQTTAQDQVGNPSEDTLGWDQYYGAGRVNAYNALVAAQALSTENNLVKNGFSIYPNPASDILNIKGDVEIDNASIFDLSGRTIQTLKNSAKLIDVSNLQSGVYILELTSNNQKFAQKFIKK